MSLDNILKALEAEAEQQVAEIEKTTQAEIERIRARARAEADAVRQKRLRAVQAPLRSEQARIINQAKLEALQRVLGTREDLLTNVLEAAAARLAALSNTASYDSVLQRLLQEAVEALGSCEQLGLHVQEQDVELMNNIVERLGLSAIVEPDLENKGLWSADLGGVEISTADGSVSLVNSLEARLQRVAGLYRSQIADMLFDHQEE